jgi:hypothetical protein
MLKISVIGNPTPTKNGGHYRSVWFRQYDMLETGALIPSNLEKMRNVFSKSDDSKGDPLYDMIQDGSVKQGGFFSGDIMKFNTTPYELNGREVQVTTLVIFSNEDAYTVADRSLKDNYASVVTEEGEVRTPSQLEKPVVSR